MLSCTGIWALDRRGAWRISRLGRTSFREHPVVSNRRCIVLAEDDFGHCRSWQVVRAEVTLWHGLQAVLRADVEPPANGPEHAAAGSVPEALPMLGKELAGAAALFQH